MTSPFGTPPSGEPSESLPPPRPGEPSPASPPPPPPGRRGPITEEVPITPGPATPPLLGDEPPPSKGSDTQVVDRPNRDAPPPDLLGPPPPTRDPGQPPWWVVAAVIGGAVVACYVVWLLTDTWVGNALADGRAWWVPLTALAAAGGLWALLLGGTGVLTRAGLGVAAGAVTGVIGSLLLGSGDTHVDAVDDTLLSGASLLRALLWGAFTAVAWAVTLGAATVRERIAHVAAGAAVGGFATGVGMGLLAGTNLFGDRVVPTDLWWPVPLRDYDAEATVLPLLLLSIGVPIAIAAVTRLAPAGAGRPLLTAAVAALFVPLLAGVAGYLTDLDEARRDGTYAGVPVEPPTLPDDLTLPDDSESSDASGPASSPPPEHTTPADTTADDSQPSATEPADVGDTAPAGSDGETPATDPGGTPPGSGLAPDAPAAPDTASMDTTPAIDASAPSDTGAPTDAATTDGTTTDDPATDAVTTDVVTTDAVPTDSVPDPSPPGGPVTTDGGDSVPAPAATDPSDTGAADTAPDPAASTPPADSTTDSTTDSLPTDSVPPPSDPDGSAPAGSGPAGPGDTVAVPFDAGIDFVATYTGVATNDNGETADVLIAVGRAAPADEVDLVWPGPPTCAPEGAAVIPFVIEVRTADPAVTYLDVRFSQGAVAPDAVADHPMTIEFHDPDGTTRCADATAPETSNTPAFTSWPAITADAPGYAYGYFIVADFFADDAATAADAAAVAVVPIVNTVVTSTQASFDGTAPREFTDPVTGEAAQALVLVP